MTASDRKRERNALLALAEEICASRGLEVVDLAVNRGPRRWNLRIDIDRPGPAGVTIDDCQAVSREMEAVLDERDLIDHSYTLEVSSPGLDRPIRTQDDIRRNTGRKIVVETSEELEGRRQFTGILIGISGEELSLRDDDDNEVRLPWASVARASQYVPF